jgi:protease I
MAGELKGKKVAILVADGFEQIEMTETRKALDDAGAETDLISPAKKEVKGWNHTDWSDKFKVDWYLDAADPSESTRWYCLAAS